MSLESDIAILSKVGFFSDFNEDQLRMVAFGSEKMKLPEGEILYNDGDDAFDGVVLLSGEIEVTRPKPDGSIYSNTMQPGSLLGEISLLTPNHRIGTATVIQNSEILIVHRETVLRVLNEYPDLAVRLFKKISTSVTQFDTELLKMDGRFN